MAIDASNAAATCPHVSVQLQHAVEQFYYHEAAILDEARFPEWLETLHDDIHYEVRTRPTLEAFSEEQAPPSVAFEDDKASLTTRVKRWETGMAWSEEPQSRTRHLITNVRITSTDADLHVASNFMVYRNRMDTTAHFLVGRREDTLRPTADAGFLVLRRIATLDQNVVLSSNLSMFF